MIEIYTDEAKTQILVSAKGSGDTSGFWVASIDREDYHAGGTRRTFSTGALQSFKRHTDKYQEMLNIENLKKDTLGVIQLIASERQRVWYCPDVEERSDELYNVMIESPFMPSYEPIKKRFSLMIEVKEV